MFIFVAMATADEIQANKEALFEEEFLPLANDLYNFAYHLTYNEQDANDLVQEAFMKAFRFANSYQKGTNAKAWLFKILKNAFINAYRKKSKQPTKVDYEEAITYKQEENEKYVGYVDLRDEIYNDMIGDELTIALNSLPVDFRTVIILSDVEEFKYEEISKILDIPIGTVRSRLFRARNLLKEKLKSYAMSLGYQDKRG